MKRFLLFSEQTYYAAGGAFDFDKSFDKVEDAEAEAKRLTEGHGRDWWHVYDSEERCIISQSETRAQQ